MAEHFPQILDFPVSFLTSGASRKPPKTQANSEHMDHGEESSGPRSRADVDKTREIALSSRAARSGARGFRLSKIRPGPA